MLDAFGTLTRIVRSTGNNNSRLRVTVRAICRNFFLVYFTVARLHIVMRVCAAREQELVTKTYVL